jgi:alpha-mannosidase
VPLLVTFGHLRAYNVDTSAPLHVGAILGWQDAEWLRRELVERGPLRQALRLEGRVGAHPVAAEVRLPAGERRVELEVRVDWQGLDGFLALLFPLPYAGELWGGIPYGVERKALEEEPYVGIERHREGMFWAQHFVVWTDGRRGLAYVPCNGDTHYVWDRAEGSLAHILLNSIHRPADTWEKDVNEQMEGRGTHTFTASLVWHAGDWRAARLWRTSAHLSAPPVVLRRRHGH